MEEIPNIRCGCDANDGIIYDSTLNLYCCKRCNRTWKGIKLIVKDFSEW